MNAYSEGRDMDTTGSLLKAILATVARGAFPPGDVYKIVAPTSGSEKQLAAYNMCDGNTPQVEIAKKLKLKESNLSRSITRWIEAGIVIRVGTEQHPMHVYPLTKCMIQSNDGER
jgi:DNA-binding HxlR family transcriptional regulator